MCFLWLSSLLGSRHAAALHASGQHADGRLIDMLASTPTPIEPVITRRGRARMLTSSAVALQCSLAAVLVLEARRRGAT